MVCEMWRLYPRGAANRGICVDNDRAMLGPDWVLVHRTSSRYQVIGRSEAAALQKCVFGVGRDPDYLFRQCHRIADALGKGEIVLAQIHGLYVSFNGLDDCELRRLALIKAGYNPDEPRIPAGDSHGGEWTTGGVQDQETQVTDVPMNRNKDDCIHYCYEQTSVPRDWGGDPFWACLRACQGRFKSPFFPEFDSHFS